MMFATFYVIAALTVAGPPAARPPVVLRGCLISAIEQVKTPAMQAGVLMKVEVRRGQEVQQGQVIAQVDDRDAVQNLAAAKSEVEQVKRKAENQVRVKAADLSAAVAEKEYERMMAINRRQPGAVPASELQQQKLSLQHARLQIELARRELKLARLEQSSSSARLVIAQNDVNDRRILAPRAGVVAEVLSRQGEWVQQSQPVFRIVRMDRLRVEGFVSLDQFSPEELKGARAMVSVHLARGRVIHFAGNHGGSSETRRLYVDFVSHEIEANGSCRISAEIDNRRTVGGDLWVLQPGMTATLSIWPKQPK